METRIKELCKKYTLQVIDGNICSLQKSKIEKDEILLLKAYKPEAIKIIISENAKVPGLSIIAATILTQQTIDGLDLQLIENNKSIARFKTV
jgi:hypothetical protein